MSGTLEGFGARFLVWIVASFSATETLLQALLNFVHGEHLDGTIWILGAAAIFGLAAFAEKVKGIGGG